MFDCLETLGISGPVKESEEHSHNGIIEGAVRGGARGRCHKRIGRITATDWQCVAPPLILREPQHERPHH